MIWGLLVGLIVGAVAKLVMPGKDPGGMIVTALLGVGGAALAGYLGKTAGWYQYGDAPGFFASVAGSVLILIAYRFTINRSSHSTPKA